MTRTILFSITSFLIGALTAFIIVVYTYPLNRSYFSETTQDYMNNGSPNDPAYDLRTRTKVIDEIAEDDTGYMTLIMSATFAAADPNPSIRTKAMDAVIDDLYAYAFIAYNILKNDWIKSKDPLLEQKRDEILVALEPLLKIEPKE